MDKNRVADVLEEIGLLLEVAGESPFRSRAYENAARTIRELDRDLVQMVQEGRLRDLKGIGEALSEKITSLVMTGSLPYYDELRASVPGVLYELVRIPGLGSKKARLLVERLGLQSLEDLERACRQDRLRDLTGFGGRMQERILKGIEQVRSYGEQVLLGQALPLADALEAALRSMREVRRADCAGSARRRRETVEGLVLVASVADAARVADAFCRLPAVESAPLRSATRLSVVCHGPLPADLVLVRDDGDYAITLLHQTGGPGHLEALGERARRRGLALREDGLFRGGERIPCPDEETIYREIGLSYVPPELQGMTRRYTAEIRNFIGPELDVPAPDMGTNEQVMVWVMDTYSQHKGHAVPGVVTGKPVEMGGTVGRREATGRGVVHLIRQTAKHLNLDLSRCTAAVQGFGNVGSVTATELASLGVKIIAVSDRTGGFYDEKGLPIDGLLRHVADHPDLAGCRFGEPISNAEMLELKCDVLVPAALEMQITAENAARLKCRILAEGANGPTSLEADEILGQKGIFVLPDILANAGGVTVSYFEWVQDLQNFFWSEEEVKRRLQQMLTRAFQEVLDLSQREKVDMRSAALMIGIDRVGRAMLRRGLYP
jgi:glutamate dehydrogenase (NAD(P)+)